MTTKTRQLSNIDGASVSVPTQNGFTATDLDTFANDAAYVSQYGTAAEGNIYQNTTDNQIHYYNGSAWKILAPSDLVLLLDGSQAMTGALDMGTGAITNVGLVDGRDVSAEFDATDTHIAASTAHGTTGNIVGLGDSPDFTGTDGVGIPSGTTAQRPGSPATGKTRFNSDDTNLEVYTGSGWVAVGSGGSAGASAYNLITNPDGGSDLDKSGTDDIGDWIDVDGSGGGGATGVVVSITTTASEIALEDLLNTGLKFTFADGGGTGLADYTRFRFQVPVGYQNQNLSLKWVQRADTFTAGQVKIEIYSYSDNYVSDEAEVPLFSDDSSGDTLISINDGAKRTAFSADSREYYELRIVNAGATAGYLAINGLTIDNNGGANGGVVTEPESVTVTGSWVSNTTYTAVETRIGSLAKYDIKIALSGAPTATALTITLPTGRTIDTSKLPNTTAVSGNVLPNSTCSFYDNATASYLGGVHYNDSTSVGLAWLDDTAGGTAFSGAVTATAPFTFASGDEITVSFIVPISEWSGSGTINQMDRGITQSNAKARFYRNAAYSYTANNVFVWDAEDTTTFEPKGNLTNNGGAIEGFTTGTYSFTVGLGSSPAWTANTVLDLQVNRAGGGFAQERLLYRLPGTTSFHASGDASIFLNTGDTVRVTANGNGTIITGSAVTYIEIARVADHSAIAPVGFGTSNESDTSTKYLLPLVQGDSWTPTVSSSGNLSTGTSGSAVGATWAIIGNMVMARIPSMTGIGNISSAANVRTYLSISTSGLPLTSASTKFFGGGYLASSTSTPLVFGVTNNGSSQILFDGMAVTGHGTGAATANSLFVYYFIND